MKIDKIDIIGASCMSLGLAITITAISCGNSHRPPPWHATEANIRDDVVELTYRGHDYLMHGASGIIHSESCPCKTNKITLELPSSRVNATQ